jgi:hypothetical protein
VFHCCSSHILPALKGGSQFLLNFLFVSFWHTFFIGSLLGLVTASNSFHLRPTPPATTTPAISSNVPSCCLLTGHVHVAQYLNVPLHIFFTMPWTPTGSFPHPLSRVKQQAGYRLSYQVVDSLIWIGISGIINAYRKKELKLRPITYLSGSQGSINQLPTGYIWSPHLVPKPKGAGLAFLFRA